MLSFKCIAQFDGSTLSGRGAALGKASATLNDFWSAMTNQAALSQQEKITVGISFCNEFLMSELSSKAIGCAIPVSKNDAFGIHYQHFGFSEYSEQKTGLAYARKFGENFSIGLQLDYLFSYINQENYLNSHYFTFECGIQYMLSKSVKFGFHAFNPISIKRSDYQDERIPAIVQIGVQYSFGEKLTGVFEIEKNIQANECLKFGLEYFFIPAICLRIGLATDPVIYSFGTGIQFGKWKLDIASAFHSILGLSPQLSAEYKF